MANKIDSVSMKKINDTLDNIDSRLDDMYRHTYYNSNTDSKTIDNISDKINKDLDTIISQNSDLHGISNISRLYSRLEMKNRGTNMTNLLSPSASGTTGKSLDSDLLAMFSDNSISSNIIETYSQNKWIMALDNEIDTVIKYMPKLKLALDIKKDNIISADNFNKDFINVENTMDKNEKATFDTRIKCIKDKYNLLDLFEDMVDEAQLRGEYFLYIVPYKKAFEKLLQIRNNSGAMSVQEMTIAEMVEGDQYFMKEPVSINMEQTAQGPVLMIHKTGMLENVIERHNKLEKTLNNINESSTLSSVYEAYINEEVNKEKDPIKNKKVEMNSITNGNLEFDPVDDGLIDPNKYNEKKSNPKITVPGTVLKKLDRSRVIPLYIDDVCLGYYYVEAMPLMGDPNRYSIGGIYDTQLSKDPTTPNTPYDSSSNLVSSMYAQNGSNDEFLKSLAHLMSEKIDSQFINTNQDLSKEIYMILKYDETFNQGYVKTNVTFLPADDVIHFKFNTDKVTHRGIPDLYNSLVPAKMWAMLNLCTTLGILTRGQDKRVYYVKQTVETNVAKSLMNVVNQIKKGNFGVRQMESINNILNIVGKFNDFVIPVGQSGESPINFEIMQGQQFDTQDNLMDKLEDAAISGVGIPLELVQTIHGTVDYAIQFSMSNSKFLRTIFKRQAIAERFFSIIISKIYNCEYGTNETITMKLPSPAFLSLSNNSTLFNNAREYVSGIVEFECADKPDEFKFALTKKLMKHYLYTHINTDLINKFVEEVEFELSLKDNNEEEQ